MKPSRLGISTFGSVSAFMITSSETICASNRMYAASAYTWSSVRLPGDVNGIARLM